MTTQDWGLVLALPGWPPDGLLMVIMELEAGGDSECSGDSNTAAMNGRVDF